MQRFLSLDRRVLNMLLEKPRLMYFTSWKKLYLKRFKTLKCLSVFRTNEILPLCKDRETSSMIYLDCMGTATSHRGEGSSWYFSFCIDLLELGAFLSSYFFKSDMLGKKVSTSEQIPNDSLYRLGVQLVCYNDKSRCVCSLSDPSQQGLFQILASSAYEYCSLTH